MEKAAAKPPLPHDLILESRSRLTVTGVQKVLHCSAESAALETGKGILHLSGAQISMQTLDLEAGEAKLTGRFDGLEYTAARAAGGFWHRLLRCWCRCCCTPGSCRKLPPVLRWALPLAWYGHFCRCGAGRYLCRMCCFPARYCWRARATPPGTAPPGCCGGTWWRQPLPPPFALPGCWASRCGRWGRG